MAISEELEQPEIANFLRDLSEQQVTAELMKTSSLSGADSDVNVDERVGDELIDAKKLKQQIIQSNEISLLEEYGEQLKWNISDLTDAVAMPRENKTIIEGIFNHLIEQGEKLKWPRREIVELNDQAWKNYSTLTNRKRVRFVERERESIVTLAKSKAIIAFNIQYGAGGEFVSYNDLRKDSEEKKTFDLLMENCCHLECCLHKQYGLEVFSEPQPCVSYHSPKTLSVNRVPIDLNSLPTSELGKMAQRSVPSFRYFLNAETISRLFALNLNSIYYERSASNKIMDVKAWPDEFTTKIQKSRIQNVERLFRAFLQIPEKENYPEQTEKSLIRDVIESHDALPAELIKIYVNSLANRKRPKPQRLEEWKAFCANYIEVVNDIQDNVIEAKQPRNFNNHLEAVSRLDAMTNAENVREEMKSSKNKSGEGISMTSLTEWRPSTFQSYQSDQSSSDSKKNLSKNGHEKKGSGPGKKHS